MQQKFLVVILIAVMVAGCQSPSALTGRETGCRTKDVKIIDSEFERTGSTTSWCARCDSKTYVCVSNAAKDRVQCRQVRPGPPCE